MVATLRRSKVLFVRVAEIPKRVEKVSRRCVSNSCSDRLCSRRRQAFKHSTSWLAASNCLPCTGFAQDGGRHSSIPRPAWRQACLACSQQEVYSTIIIARSDATSTNSTAKKVPYVVQTIFVVRTGLKLFSILNILLLANRYWLLRRTYCQYLSRKLLKDSL